MIRFFQKVWKNTACRIIIKILLVFGVLCLLYFFTRFFFPALPYEMEDIYDLTDYQLRKFIFAYEVCYGRLKYLLVQVFGAGLLASLLLYHSSTSAKNRATDFEKEIDKEKADYQKLRKICDELKESYKANEKELKDQIDDLKQQLKTEGIDNTDLYNEIDELQYQVKKLQSDVDFYKDDWEAEYDINSELKEKIKKKDALIQELTQKITE